MWMAKKVLDESNEVIVLYYIPLLSTAPLISSSLNLHKKQGVKECALHL
jgi:hypothetical protein